MKLKNQLLLIGLGLVLFVFFYVWPGVCRYNYCTIPASPAGRSYEGRWKESRAHIERVDRLTGHVQNQWNGGWK